MKTNAIDTQRFVTAENLALLMVLAMISNTQADPLQTIAQDTFTPYVRGLYGYDSNLFRLQNDQAAMAILGTTDTAESYHTLAAGMDVNLRISRQAIKAHAEFNQTRFNKYTGLGYNGRDTSLQWNWLVGSMATGDAGIAESLTQASFVDIKQPINNLIRTRKGFFHTAIKVGNPWQVKLGLDRTNLSNNAAIQQTLDSTVDTVSTGVQYQTTEGTRIEWVSQRSDGNYPNPQIVGLAAVNNGYRQWDNGVKTNWSPTAKTQLSGRLNYTQRSYADVPQRNFSGITGRVALNWMVTDKTTLRSALYRDIGAVTYPTASYAVIQGVALGADWKPTAKVAVNLQISHDRIAYTGDPGFVLSTVSARRDQLNAVRAGVSYNLLRNTTLGLVLQRGAVHSNQALMSYGYSSAMFNLRSEF
ncbi:hypothetical protein TPL01_11450 [Sulfuriferula plumbiphila]|uniref:Uncharacterized protein n=2 Tax=Sulfuriferula plumbiphila TaxID=171865 RepID=A0A512L6B8_9PROT|nr:hypothetical protein SFPGR_10280 [Sulfuriferula plumbiphila]GEP30007.1 hypothetical protein TPL01_11450 [Sulfuriferula plumbiphila]